MAKRRHRQKTGYPLWILFIILMAACLSLGIFYGFQKEGFHEDEYYTYYSSNRTAGLFTPDRTWVDTNRIEDEFIVLPGEIVTYPLIAEVQSWDVHPPLYYDIFHTIASFWPGGFSKWPGLITNYLALFLCFILLNRLMYYLELPVWMRLLVLCLFSLHPLTVSMEMFIRMYLWLTVFILACALVHVRFAAEIAGGRLLRMNLSRIFVKFFLPMLIVTFLGFLMHYYFLVFHFFIAIAFLLFLIFGGHDFGLTRVTSVALYAGFQLIAYAAAFALFPSAAAQIFTGYRGREARDAFLSFSNTWERFSFFLSIINERLFFGIGTVLLILLAIAFGAVWFFRSRQMRHQEMSLGSVETRAPETDVVVMLLIATTGYFLVVAKTALLLGATSARYLYPVCPLILLLVLYGLYAASRTLQELGDDGDTYRNTVIRSRIWIAIRTTVSFLLLAVMVVTYVRGNAVMFLYREDAALKTYALNERTNPALILYNDETPHNIWRLTNVIIEYPEVYFVNESNLAPFDDPAILTADTLTVYAADDDGRDELLRMLSLREITPDMKKENEELKDIETTVMNYTTVAAKEMWTVYRFERAGE